MFSINHTKEFSVETHMYRGLEPIGRNVQPLEETSACKTMATPCTGSIVTFEQKFVAKCVCSVQPKK